MRGEGGSVAGGHEAGGGEEGGDLAGVGGLPDANAALIGAAGHAFGGWVDGHGVSMVAESGVGAEEFPVGEGVFTDQTVGGG